MSVEKKDDSWPKGDVVTGLKHLVWNLYRGLVM